MWLQMQTSVVHEYQTEQGLRTYCTVKNQTKQMGDQVFLKIEEQKMIWCEEALLKYHVSIK